MDREPFTGGGGILSAFSSRFSANIRLISSCFLMNAARSSGGVSAKYKKVQMSYFSSTKD